jgi:hypothetical protein
MTATATTAVAVMGEETGAAAAAAAPTPTLSSSSSPSRSSSPTQRDRRRPPLQPPSSPPPSPIRSRRLQYHYQQQQQHRHCGSNSSKKCLSDGDLSTLITRSTCADTTTASAFGDGNNNYNDNDCYCEEESTTSWTDAAANAASAAGIAGGCSGEVILISKDEGGGSDCDGDGILTASQIRLGYASAAQERKRIKSRRMRPLILHDCDVDDEDADAVKDRILDTEEIDGGDVGDSVQDQRQQIQQQQDSAASTDELIFPQFASITDTLDDYDDNYDYDHHLFEQKNGGTDKNHSKDTQTRTTQLPRGIPCEVLVFNDDQDVVGEKDEDESRHEDNGVALRPTQQPRNVSSSMTTNPAAVATESVRLAKAEAKIKMYENLVSIYRQKIKSSEQLTDTLNDYLRQTQGYADDLLEQRKELVETIEQLEHDEERRNDQETLCLAITFFSLIVYFLGGSHQFLVAAVVLQLIVSFVNAFI